jgi:hypothetical protein
MDTIELYKKIVSDINNCISIVLDDIHLINIYDESNQVDENTKRIKTKLCQLWWNAESSGGNIVNILEKEIMIYEYENLNNAEVKI